MSSKTLSDWSDPDRYHGFKPPLRAECWDDKLCIYVIRGGPFIKIGVAADPVRRIAGLRSGCPYPLETVSIRTAPRILAYQVERKVHKALAEHHAYGEWFTTTPEVIAPVLSLHISRAKLAIEKWRRDGYLTWRPAYGKPWLRAVS